MADAKPPLIRWHKPMFLVAALLAIVAAIAGVVHLKREPNGMALALPQDALSIANTIRSSVSADERLVKFTRIMTGSPAEAVAAVDEGRAQVALTRTDIAMPRSGGTIVIVRRDALALGAQRRARITNIAALAGKTVAVVEGANGSDRRLVEKLLRYYDLQDKVTLESIPLLELPAAFASRRVAAAFAVAAPQNETFRSVVKAAGERQAVVVPIPEADAIAKRTPGLEAMELGRGAFGGTTPMPTEAVTTISVSWRYVAATTANKARIQSATRQILSVRSQVNGQAPFFLKIEAPSTDKDAAFPVHAGAAAFIDDEPDQTFDRIESLFYLIVMSSGILGSLVAAFMGMWRHKVGGQLDPDENLGELLQSVDQAPLEKLDELERSADRQVRRILKSPNAVEKIPVCAFLVTEVRRAVEQRRKALTEAAASGDGGQPRVH